MKKAITIMYVLLFTATLISCGGGGDDSVPVDTTAESTWKFEEYTYNAGIANEQITPNADIGDFGVLVISTNEDNSNGDFSGSVLTLTYAVQGSGTYAVVSQQDFIDARFEDATAKVMTLSCTVGTATVSASLYESLTNGSASVSLDDSGKYHISTSGLQITKTIEVGNGVPNAPATGTLKITNAFDL